MSAGPEELTVFRSFGAMGALNMQDVSSKAVRQKIELRNTLFSNQNSFLIKSQLEMEFIFFYISKLNEL